MVADQPDFWAGQVGCPVALVARGNTYATRRRAREGPGEGQGNPATNGASSAAPGPPAAPVRHARVLIYPSRYAGAGLGSGGRCAGLSVVAGLQLQPTPGKLSAGLGC